MIGTSTNDLMDIIENARAAGAVILVTYDEDAKLFEGRDIIESVQVIGGMKGIGPFPMPPLYAAETIRRVMAEAA